MSLIELQSRFRLLYKHNTYANKQLRQCDGIFEEKLEIYCSNIIKKCQKIHNTWINKNNKLFYQTPGFENNNCI
jgi:hypothetical protein